MVKQLAYLFLLLGAFQSAFSQIPYIGAFDASSDIGNCGVPGSALYNGKTHEYKISGSGADIWGRHDAFHYLWKKLNGDFILQFDFSFVGQGKNQGRKVGWMVRNDISDSSAHINGMLHNSGLTCIQYRLAKGGTTSAIDSKAKVLDIVRFERRGNVYILSTAAKGEPFTSLEFTDTANAINNEACVGIFICSHENDTRETAIIRNVSITVPEHSKKNIIVWDGELATPGAGWVTKNGECTV
jgi:TolB protein